METIKIKECVACGARSVPFFGMAWGCRENGGSHREMRDVEVPAAHIKKQLKAVYDTAPSFDRAKFNKFASVELKALIR